MVFYVSNVKLIMLDIDGTRQRCHLRKTW